VADALLEIVIVNATGGRDLLRECLRSLECHPVRSGDSEVWVVDNASEDGAPEMVQQEFPRVRVEPLSWNAGFSVANNIALRQTTAPYVLLLNPDTEVSEGALDHMLEVMRLRPEVGMASCRLVQPDGTFDHAAKRSFPTPLGALAHFARVGRSGKAPRALQQYRAVELGEFEEGEVDAVNGAFMLVRREALENVGLLDEAYWLYMEDLDWCYRFKHKGWKVWYDGRISIVHVKGGASIHQKGRARHRGLRSNLAFHRSMGRFYRKFYAGRQPLVDAAVYFAIGGKLAVSVARSTIARRSLA
jgi:N-acetylglucosaminyl-diphospho-decaprenol L-rhamnosyltransferase